MGERGIDELEDVWICLKCGHKEKLRDWTGKTPACRKCGGTMKKVVVVK